MIIVLHVLENEITTSVVMTNDSKEVASFLLAFHLSYKWIMWFWFVFYAFM